MDDSHKPHRAPHAGNKADKKKATKNVGASNKGNNPRAFTMSGSRKAAKIARRSTEVVSYSLNQHKMANIVVADGREEIACADGGPYTRGTSASGCCRSWTPGGEFNAELF